MYLYIDCISIWNTQKKKEVKDCAEIDSPKAKSENWRIDKKNQIFHKIKGIKRQEQVDVQDIKHAPSERQR